MPTPLEVALDHAGFRRRLALAVADEARRMWLQVDPGRIRQSWAATLTRLLVLVTGAQRAAAGQADSYLDAVLDAQDLDASAAARLTPGALAGIASDGRDLTSLLYRPAVASVYGLQQGQPLARSLAGGGAVLDMIVRTQVADAGRVADQVAATARPQATGFVRMLVGRTCARCAILAGRWYRYNAGFNRHPRCDCIALPGRENVTGDLRTDPKRYFASLTAAEQDRQFTQAGAEAIRTGADLAQVVNARSGMYTAGGQLYTTTGAGRRPRPMPEHLLAAAKGDRSEALRLLRLHGYLR